MMMAAFRYIFSFVALLLFSESFLYAQNEDLFVQPEEKEPLKFLGVKFGVNVGRFADFQFRPERFSYEGSFDFNFGHKYFGVIEAGYSEIELEKDNYKYISDGTFYKLGLDYNMLKKYPSDYLGVGFRLGRAEFSHSATDIVINPDYWPSLTTSSGPKSYTAYWFEGSLGIKGELFKNVYFGWSAMVKIRVFGGKDGDFQPYDIPGLGKGSNAVKLGANYYIYYQIPFNRK